MISTPFKKCLFATLCLLAAPVLAAGPASKSAGPKAGSAATRVPDPERYARRCQPQAAHRDNHPQGTLLWGTRQDWDPERSPGERSSVLVSVELGRPVQAGASVKGLRFESGRLVAAPESSVDLSGTVLRGMDSHGKPVEVSICAAEPSPEDPDLVWYRVEAWNPIAQEWENPCVATSQVPQPRALAVGGVWDGTGARHDSPGKITFACENGAITKCVRWGFKPWASKDGKSLADLHQACTRMARADYCGNGQSHTHQDTMIDMYDRLGVSTRSTEASASWDPARGSFEAAWAPDGATCLARTRDGRALDTILKECPGRFRTGAAELGDGDRCTVARAGVDVKKSLLQNQSYGTPPETASKGASK